MKNKTLASWMAFLGGPLGLHRFYLYGWADTLGWLLPLPTALGIYGLNRIGQLGMDDTLGWVLIPVGGLTVSGCALTAILYALTPAERWNTRFNPGIPSDSAAGRTGWLTVAAGVAALMVGATVLMSSIVIGAQKYFESQVEAARKISQ